ncbi:hypothetical protein MPSEU_000847400 [Mayamaea pseudoterrestris]|nr:hypothetical protein MPSEU_000847400 [Mayamaea pseudoterrestris]
MSSYSATYESTSTMVVIGSCVALTLQLVRLSIDLVQAASNAPSTETTPRVAATATTSNGSSSKNKMDALKVLASNTASSTSNPLYGSTMSNPIRTSEGSATGVKNGSSNIDEALPLLGTSLSSDEFGDETLRHRSMRLYFFYGAWSVLSLMFASASLTPWLATTSAYPVMLLAVTSINLALEVALLARDASKQRSGAIQRFLQNTVYLISWFMYVRTWQTQVQNNSSNVSSSISTFVWIGLATLTVLLSILDGWVTVHLPHVQRQCACQKQYVSRRALFVMLKPYFWPDATDDSAIRNRMRAIATWVMVVGSKVCGLYSPLYLGWASTSLAHADYRKTVIYAVAHCVVSFLGAAMKEGQSLVYLKVAQAAFVQLSEASFEHLHSLSLDFHIRKKLGETLRSMDRGIAACDTLMKYLFLWLVPAAVECVVVCIIFATYFQYMPLAIAVFYFVFVYIVWTILVTLWRKRFRKALVQSDNRYHDIFTDSIVNYETVKYFTAERFERDRFSDAVKHYQAGSTNVQASLSFLNISQQALLKCCLATALALSVLGIRKRSLCCTETMGCDAMISDCCANVSTAECPGMRVGDFVAVLTYTLNLFAPLNFLGSVYNAVVMAFVDLGNMSELLAENPDVIDAPDAMELPLSNTANPDIAVEFDNVRFHYPSQPSNQGLKGLSFVMKRGTTTAVVGSTGAGKTTISRLLFRFYDVIGGAVKVNGVDVRCVTQKSLRDAIGVVPQAAALFNDTIRFNLAYGRRNATQQELEQAADDAQILKFIESLDDGWDSMVGDRGLKLSGGEAQRAAIARCLLKNPPFVLLDEATSSLDNITERSVQDALDRLGQDRTVLVIAHRLGTIRNADNIVVVKDGVVAEQGTHDELLKCKGIYAEMWNMQLHSSK